MYFRVFSVLLMVAILHGCGGGGATNTTNNPPLVNTGDDSNNPPLVNTGDDSNNPPLINAGANFRAEVGAGVTLAGSASDPDGDSLSYTWTFTSTPTDSTASLANPGQLDATFTPDLVGTYTIELMASDGTDQASNTVSVTAELGNIAPVANMVASQVVAPGSLVQVDGTGSSDANNDILTYQWTFISRPSGSSAFFDNANSAQPAFTADVTGEYVIQLVVHDGELYSDPVTATIIASSFSITVTWPANSDDPAGYTVYTGPTIDTADTLLKILVRDAPDWDPLNPSAILAGDTIIAALSNSAQACFVVKAYNGVGLSVPSDATCVQISP